MFEVKRANKVILAIMLILALPITYVFASFVSPKPEETEPEIMGAFIVNIEINNVEDLYAWQVLLAYDPNTLILSDITPGGFIGRILANAPDGDVEDVFVKATDIGNGLLLIGGSLIGSVPGKDGSGLLAKITFGYLSDEYPDPQILAAANRHQTMLLNSKGDRIPIDDGTITLSIEK